MRDDKEREGNKTKKKRRASVVSASKKKKEEEEKNFSACKAARSDTAWIKLKMAERE